MFANFSNRLRRNIDPRARLDRQIFVCAGIRHGDRGFFVASGGGVDGFRITTTTPYRDGAVARTYPASPSPTKSGSPEPARLWPSTDPFATGWRRKKPLWLTETAAAACGGNPWDATFLDMFRYLDQLGRLAKGGVQVVLHNTLAASDYGLLDETTFAPRPDYWGALLWHRLMGRTVLDPGASSHGGSCVSARIATRRRPAA